MSVWVMKDNPLSRRVKEHEHAVSVLNEGIPPHLLDNARATLRAARQDRSPSISEGAQASAMVKGEEYFVEHVESSDSEKRHLVHRPLGGGRYESLEIREERADDHSWVVASKRRI